MTREVKANRLLGSYAPGPGKRASAVCARYDGCEQRGSACAKCVGNPKTQCRSCRHARCFEGCPDLIAGPRCPEILAWPYTCARCGQRASCSKRKVRYRADEAQAACDSRRAAPREGICCSNAELAAMNALVTPLIKKGQSPEAIWVEHGWKLPVDARTYRRYMDMGLTDAVALDLPRKVRRKQAGADGAPARDRVCRTGREYRDFLALPEEVRLGAWEGDTVVGLARNAKRLLSLHLARLSLHIYLLLAGGATGDVVGRLDMIERLLGSPAAFELAMGVILFDRGPEFSDWAGMERSCLQPNTRRCRVFYADAQHPGQRGSCERDHEELRRILPKGRSDFDALCARDVALASSHVNSYPRPSLGNARPYDLAQLVLPELIDGVGLFRVGPDEVMLRPELLPHAMMG